MLVLTKERRKVSQGKKEGLRRSWEQPAYVYAKQCPHGCNGVPTWRPGSLSRGGVARTRSRRAVRGLCRWHFAIVDAWSPLHLLGFLNGSGDPDIAPGRNSRAQSTFLPPPYIFLLLSPDLLPPERSSGSTATSPDPQMPEG